MAYFDFIRWIHDEITDKEIEESLEKSKEKVSKPCWVLKYCPYGILVEFFPLPNAILRDQAIFRIEHIKRELQKGTYNERMTPIFQKEVDEFDPLEYPETEEELKFKMESCKYFGHICPIYFTGEYFDESAYLISKKYSISHNQMNIAAFNSSSMGSYICTECYKNIKDHEVEFIKDESKKTIKLVCNSCSLKY